MGKGLSTFDLLGDLPATQRTLMRLFLRRVRMNEAELDSEMAELPEEKRLNAEQTREALAALLQLGWIKLEQQNGQAIYSVLQQSTKH